MNKRYRFVQWNFDHKIFFLGFNKTATGSIHKFFTAHEFPSVHWDRGLVAKCMLKNTLEHRPLLGDYSAKYVVFSDLNFRKEGFWFEGNGLFRLLDRQYPDSFFIYNTRDIDAWLVSRYNHYSNKDQETLGDYEIRNSNLAERENVVYEIWRKRRELYELEISNYFSDSSNFLALNIESQHFVSSLSTFLNYEFNPEFWTKSNISRARV